MNFADNWARVFVVITFLTFGQAQIIGGMIPNLVGLAIFFGVIIYFDQTRKAKVRRGEKVPPHQ